MHEAGLEAPAWRVRLWRGEVDAGLCWVGVPAVRVFALLVAVLGGGGRGGGAEGYAGV